MTTRSTTNRPAAPIGAPATEPTSPLTEAVTAGSVTLSQRHEIAVDLRERRLAALDRAARDHDEDAVDAAERGYDAAMHRLLMLPVLPTGGIKKWRELDFAITDPALHTDWTD